MVISPFVIFADQRLSQKGMGQNGSLQNERRSFRFGE
jgi:hypothetical protein